MANQTALDPERLIKVLAKHRVDFVLIGALAARLQGFPRLTADGDITPARDPANLSRLSAALRNLNARVFTEGVPKGFTFRLQRAGLVGGRDLESRHIGRPARPGIYTVRDSRYEDLIRGAL